MSAPTGHQVQIKSRPIIVALFEWCAWACYLGEATTDRDVITSKREVGALIEPGPRALGEVLL